ncbi:MAG: transposase [Candidatus Omnitrophica bacterium]|nr:transposase [Candidatus Omnitrophota bacterium]
MEKDQMLFRRTNLRHRVIYPHAIYHLTQRAPGDEPLFQDEKDYLFMLSLIKETARLFNWRVLSFALMPNHIHILLQITGENLSEGAKYLLGRYAVNFNKKYKRKGPVFCRPFRAFLCLSDKYLFAISAYIHLNPCKAKLVDNPAKYRWSSVALFTEDKDCKTFVDYKSVLSILHKDIKRARQIYRSLFEKGEKLDYQDGDLTSRFINKFCFEMLQLKKEHHKSEQDEEALDVEEEVENFKRYRNSKKFFGMSKKKLLIERLIRQGYRISDISKVLGVSRQYLYRLLE